MANSTPDCYSVFAYPGNKSQAAPWIVRTFPDHRTRVHVFGGAAGVLANSPRSHVEVYNDVNDDPVTFLQALRDHPDELLAWLRNVPNSRAEFERWERKWYDEGWRPDGIIRHAGVFWCLQQQSYAGKIASKAGFATSTIRSQARTFENQKDRLEAFADRFRGVTLECLDWRDVLPTYDSDETLFYCDPPYPDSKKRCPDHDVDHAALADALAAVDGHWVASYQRVPEPVREAAVTVLDRETVYDMRASLNGPSGGVTEHLVLSFDPANVEPFVDRQATLDGGVAVEGGGRRE